MLFTGASHILEHHSNRYRLPTNHHIGYAIMAAAHQSNRVNPTQKPSVPTHNNSLDLRYGTRRIHFNGEFSPFEGLYCEIHGGGYWLNDGNSTMCGGSILSLSLLYDVLRAIFSTTSSFQRMKPNLVEPCPRNECVDR
jgi:hypothetical protein